MYRPWLSMLSPSIEACAVRLPGRESRLNEPPFTEIEPLIETLLAALHPYLETYPFAFFGHSMGALVSFELARRLHQQGGPLPVHLFVSSHRAPHLPNPNPPVHDLPEAAFIEELRRLQGTPEAVLQNAELLHLILPLLRADFALCERYTYRPMEPLPCPITASGGFEDADVSPEELAAWGQHTSGPFSRRLFPGDHFYLHQAAPSLCQMIAEVLRVS